MAYLTRTDSTRDIPWPYRGRQGEDELIKTPILQTMQAFTAERRTGNPSETS